MGSFLIIVVKLYRNIDNKVVKLRKFKYFYDVYTFAYRVKYGLTRDLIFFIPVKKVKYISNC